MRREALTSTTVGGALDEARRRIRDDKRGVSQEVADLLDAIAQGLEHGAFNLRDRPLKTLGRFRLTIGVEANAYLDQQRLAVAYHLAGNSQVPIAEIGEGLGFRSPELFRKWFTGRLGEAPDSLRHTDQPARPAQKEPWRPPSGSDWPTQWDWERLLLGAVSPEEADRLLLILLSKYPRLASEFSREPVEV